ncbi:MAG: hypothetical protein JWQ81_2634 [Amycolatopsis sp.]|jgi:hypothetical protein|uniref:hypothetical protein n=1 Tax=Amycolatopsis sp. TaxID=37632 RepID=UPI00261BBD73|nr:hypothetical protein [Amycolatopsis sp.]MCU1681895.1 hypothetical protein [Amycolatopsis sp.]
MADGQGFTVDVDALKEAGLRLSDLLAALHELQVENIDCDRKFVGHTGPEDSYETFTTRWQICVTNLTKTFTQLSGHQYNARAPAYLNATGVRLETRSFDRSDPAPETNSSRRIVSIPLAARRNAHLLGLRVNRARSSSLFEHTVRVRMLPQVGESISRRGLRIASASSQPSVSLGRGLPG